MIRISFFYKVSQILIIVFALVTTYPFSKSLAHPGNTAADGCHYCKTNCDKWGVAWNERHCHNTSKAVSTRNSNQGSSDKSQLGNVVTISALGLAGYYWNKSRKK